MQIFKIYTLNVALTTGHLSLDHNWRKMRGGPGPSKHDVFLSQESTTSLDLGAAD